MLKIITIVFALALVGCATPITPESAAAANNYDLCVAEGLQSHTYPFLVNEVEKRKINCRQIIAEMAPVIEAQRARQQAASAALMNYSAQMQAMQQQQQMMNQPVYTNCFNTAMGVNCSSY